MNTYFKKTLMLICGILSLASCQNDTEHLLPKGQNVCKVYFKANVQSFDAQTTRAADVEWKDKDCVYLQFPANGQYVKGQLVYDEAANDWTLTYNGSLPATSSGTCTAYYFLGDYTKDEKKVALTPNTSVYKDEKATYSYSNGVLSISTNLSPITGRIRFKGTTGTVFKVYGLQYYSNYSISSSTMEEELVYGKLEKEYSPLTMIVGDDGYSKYVYCTKASNKEISIEMGDYIYTATLEDNVLVIGKSGMMSLPTESKYNGWRKTKDKIIMVDDVIFRMIYVEGGTFLMGETGTATDLDMPTVTLSNYYIGETEVSQALWKKVMDANPSSQLNVRFPVHNVSWDDCQSFVSKLGKLTDKGFRLPTEAEWEFAARGGNDSQGYIYSGSNSIDAVACYKTRWESASNPNVPYPAIGYIGCKSANELWIYDMTGNVNEWCNDWYGEYPAGNITNPTGPITGSYRVIRGYTSDVNYGMRNTTRSNSQLCTRGAFGLRLVMEP